MVATVIWWFAHHTGHVCIQETYSQKLRLALARPGPREGGHCFAEFWRYSEHHWSAAQLHVQKESEFVTLCFLYILIPTWASEGSNSIVPQLKWAMGEFQVFPEQQSYSHFSEHGAEQESRACVALQLCCTFDQLGRNDDEAQDTCRVEHLPPSPIPDSGKGLLPAGVVVTQGRCPADCVDVEGDWMQKWRTLQQKRNNRLQGIEQRDWGSPPLLNTIANNIPLVVLIYSRMQIITSLF